MPYKVKKLVRKVPIFSDNGKFIPAEDITIDRLTKADSSVEEVIIAWFDKSINPDLFDNCSKVQFAVSQDTPGTVTLAPDTEDVPLANLYHSSESFTPEQIKAFVKDHAKVIKVTDLTAYPPAGYTSATIAKPTSITGSDANIKVAVIPLSDIENIATTYVYAWTIKSAVLDTGTTAEIITIN